LTAEVPQAGRVHYTRQQEAKGLGHAVWCARQLIEDEPFAVVLVDDLIHSKVPCLKQMIEAQAKTGGNVVAVMEVAHEHTARYGIVDPGAEDGRLVEVKGMVEKPDPAAAPSRYAVIGRYILDADVFKHLGRHEVGAGGEIQLTDAMEKLIGSQPFHGYRFEGERYDCGDKLGYLEAIVATALARDDLGDDFRAVLDRYRG
jgi:UTP--glucose-1-phosphate uridylyltransferase